MNPEAYPALLRALQEARSRAAFATASAAPAPVSPTSPAPATPKPRSAPPDDYAKLIAARSATQLLLRTVYVRVLEDLGLLDPPRLRGQRGAHLFGALAPALGYRGLFTWTLRDLAVDFPDLFTPLDDDFPA
ncbi:MAG: hypothetical protein R3F65_25535 [bacterium]